MERLTEYDEFGNAEFVGIDNTKLYERLVCDETVALTIATNKLAELEDVLEKYGIESAEELEHQLAVKDKALELACKYNIPDDEHSHITLRFSDTGVQVEKTVGVFDLQENQYVVYESVILLKTAHLLCDLFNKTDKQSARIKELEEENKELKDYTENTANLIDKLTEDSVSASKQLAIEVLEKIKHYILTTDKSYADYDGALERHTVAEYIDNQIKELRGEEDE